MSFFEPPPRRPEPPPQRWRQPPWVGPPHNVVGGVAALELLVARSENAAVWLGSATAYPTGAVFELEVRWRPAVQRNVRMHGGLLHDEPLEEDEGLPDEMFRVGFQLADGSKATTLDRWPGSLAITEVVTSPLVSVGEGPGPPAAPAVPVLSIRGGSGGPDGWSQRLWLWPLPAEAPLAFVCEWPALGIELTRVEVDVAALRAAAARSRTLWADD